MSHDFEPLSARIIEAAIAVHGALGPGFPSALGAWIEWQLKTIPKKPTAS
jgi:hypothetical protein